MSGEEQIKQAVKEYVLENKEDFIGKKYYEIIEQVKREFVHEMVLDGVLEAMDEFPPDHDPYDEAKERMILAKHGIEI